MLRAGSAGRHLTADAPPPPPPPAAGKKAPLRGSVAPRAEQGESQPLEVLRRENELLKKTISTAETAGKQPRRTPAASRSPGAAHT